MLISSYPSRYLKLSVMWYWTESVFLQYFFISFICMWRYWLGYRKGIWSVRSSATTQVCSWLSMTAWWQCAVYKSGTLSLTQAQHKCVPGSAWQRGDSVLSTSQEHCHWHRHNTSVFLAQHDSVVTVCCLQVRDTVIDTDTTQVCSWLSMTAWWQCAVYTSGTLSLTGVMLPWSQKTSQHSVHS